jgi:hypothetical protein
LGAFPAAISSHNAFDTNPDDPGEQLLDFDPRVTDIGMVPAP